MADKDDAKDKEEKEPLTEAQRLDAIEKKMGTSRTIMMIVALLLVMVISVAVTAFIVFIGKSSNKEESELLAQIAVLQEEVTSLSAKVDEQNLRVEQVADSVPDVDSQIKKLSNSVIIDLMVEQETGNQEFLGAARSSIYDLAHMVPGSRTWLEVYSEQIDSAVNHSKDRQKRLYQLNQDRSGGAAPVEIEDDGFGDF